ncbi:MAG: ABC transporter permease [Bacteroidales bacterium]
MKLLFRNLLSICRKFKLPMLLNILGLSVAFVAFMITLIKVYSEFSFESMHKNRDRIYMVEFSYEDMISDNIHQRYSLERLFESSPLIEQKFILFPFLKNVEIRIKDQNQDEKAFVLNMTPVTPDITQLFDFQIINGDAGCLKDPEKVMMPVSMANKLFGRTDVVGETITPSESVWSTSQKKFTIGAVYNDFPYNTQLSNDIYLRMDPDFSIRSDEGRNFLGYVMLSSPDAAQTLEANFQSSLVSNDYNKDLKVKLVPIEDLYFYYDNPLMTKGGDRATLYILFCVGLLVLIIAMINHMNLTASLAPIRIRSINTQKVFGSSNAHIRTLLIAESVLISVSAFLISLFFLWLVSRSGLLSFIESDLSVINNLAMVLITGSIALLLGVITGMYPAFYMTSFPPAVVLKGTFGLSSKGKVLRNTLVGFQLVITVAFISASTYLYLQNAYMKNSDMGFDKDQIAVVQSNRTIMVKNKEEIARRLKQNPMVEDIAYSSQKVGASDSYQINLVKTPKGDEFTFSAIFVSSNFFEVMGIPVIEGATPTLADQQTKEGVYIFNRLARDLHDLKPLDKVTGYFGYPTPVIGFFGNITLTSKRMKEQEIGFFVKDDLVKRNSNMMYVRMSKQASPIEVSILIHKVFREFDQTAVVDVEFYDTIISRLYEKEANMERLILLLTMLTILLSVIGLFGLVLFEAQYKRKEIGVRKVFGASTGEILYSLNMTYLRMVLICTLISIPLTYLGVQTWLETFAYRIPVYWWVFALSATVVLIITLLTVSSQSWKAARENPVNSVKSL